MADPITITIKDFALRRSAEPGYLPESLKLGEPFVHLVDGFVLFGDGSSLPSDLPKLFFDPASELLRPGGPLEVALLGVSDALRGGVSTNFDTLAKIVATLALPAAAQRFSAADENLSEGQTDFTIIGGYAPGIVTVYRNGLVVPTDAYTATDGSKITLGDPVGPDDVIDVRPNQGGGVLNAAPVVHTHTVQQIQGLTTAWLAGLLSNLINGLPKSRDGLKVGDLWDNDGMPTQVKSL